MSSHGSSHPPPDKKTPRRGRPLRGTVNEEKEAKLQKQRDATSKSRERKKAGELLKPRIQYGQQESPRVTRRNVPIDTFDERGELPIEPCSVRDAIHFFRHDLAIEQERLASSRSPDQVPVKIANPFWCGESPDGSFQLYEPNWVTQSRNALNHAPFLRSHFQSVQVDIFNNNYKDWIMRNCADVTEGFFYMKATSATHGHAKPVKFEAMFHPIMGILSEIEDTLGHPSQGPFFPIPTSSKDIPNTPVKKSSTRRRMDIMCEPFVMIYNKDPDADFGSYNDGDVLITNKEMGSLVPGQLVEGAVVDVAGMIISKLSKTRPYATPFHFITVNEFEYCTSSLNEREIEKIMTRIKNRLLQGPHSGVNRICCTIHLNNHYVVAIGDRVTHDISLYDPMIDGGVLKRVKGSLLSDKLLKFGILLSRIHGEESTAWNAGVKEWRQMKAPKLLGIQVGAVDCGAYCLLYLEILAKLSEVCSAAQIKAHENGSQLSWDVARQRYFNYIVKEFETQKSLRPPKSRANLALNIQTTKSATATSVDTPTTALAKTFDAKLEIGGYDGGVSPEERVTSPDSVEQADLRFDHDSDIEYGTDTSVAPQSFSASKSFTVIPNNPVKKSFSKKVTLDKITAMSTSERLEKVGTLDNGNIPVVYRDLLKFSKNVWFNDNLVNGLLHTIRRHNAGTFGTTGFVVIDSNFVNDLIRDKPKPSRTKRTDSVYHRLNMLRQYERLLIPYNYGGNHWTLIIVEFTGTAITFYDPYKKPDTVITQRELSDNLEGIKNCIVRVLKEGLSEKENVELHFTVGSQYHTLPVLGQQFSNPDRPRSSDQFNCGVFVTLFVMAYTRSPFFDPVLALQLSSSDESTRTAASVALRNNFFTLIMKELERRENRL